MDIFQLLKKKKNIEMRNAKLKEKEFLSLHIKDEMVDVDR